MENIDNLKIIFADELLLKGLFHKKFPSVSKWSDENIPEATLDDYESNANIAENLLVLKFVLKQKNIFPVVEVSPSEPSQCLTFHPVVYQLVEKEKGWNVYDSRVKQSEPSNICWTKAKFVSLNDITPKKYEFYFSQYFYSIEEAEICAVMKAFELMEELLKPETDGQK